MEIISRKSRYALHGLAYIAAFSEGEPVPFAEILAYLRTYAPGLTLSPGYVGKIFQEVSRAGFTQAVPGPRGGYRLARPPEQISLIEIIEALEGPLLSDCCPLSVGGCPHEATCGVRRLVRQAETDLYQFFEGQTLASLVRQMEFPDRDEVRARRRARPRRVGAPSRLRPRRRRVPSR